MSTTPMYDAVVQELDIDPTEIASRPAWSFESAEARTNRKMKQPAGSKKVSKHSRAERVRPVKTVIPQATPVGKAQARPSSSAR